MLAVITMITNHMYVMTLEILEKVQKHWGARCMISPNLGSPLPSSPFFSLPLQVGPLKSTYGGSGARTELRRGVVGRSPSRNRIWCISTRDSIYAI